MLTGIPPQKLVRGAKHLNLEAQHHLLAIITPKITKKKEEIGNEKKLKSC